MCKFDKHPSTGFEEGWNWYRSTTVSGQLQYTRTFRVLINCSWSSKKIIIIKTGRWNNTCCDWPKGPVPKIYLHPRFANPSIFNSMVQFLQPEYLPNANALPSGGRDLWCPNPTRSLKDWGKTFRTTNRMRITVAEETLTWNPWCVTAGNAHKPALCS